MAEFQEVRWQQRLSNLQRALAVLGDAVRLSQRRELSALEQQGLIQVFEFCHELAWNVMKDYAHLQGNVAIAGARDASREALKMGIISDGEAWMSMLKSRNLTSHTYNQAVAEQIVDQIVSCYYPIFVEFSQHMEGRKQ